MWASAHQQRVREVSQCNIGNKIGDLMQKHSVPKEPPSRRSGGRRLPSVVTAIVAAFALFVGLAIPAWAADSITLTFVRHGETSANAAGIISTAPPGEPLDATGVLQADAVAAKLSADGTAYDAIFTSDAIRTQQTAAPFALLHPTLPVTHLGGLNEVNGGIFEGQSDVTGVAKYLYGLPGIVWTLGLRFVPILGSTDPNGNAFESRVNGAIQTIYNSGAQNPVIFSHGATIMFWTMMNVENPDISLLLTHQLGNTGVVVVTGNPTDGWTLQSWDGIAVSATPDLPTSLFVATRDLIVAPQTAVYNVGQALRTGDIAKIVNAVTNGVVNVAVTTAKFPVVVAGDIVTAIKRLIPGAATTPSPAAVTTAAVESDTTTTATSATDKLNSSVATDLSDATKAAPSNTTTGAARNTGKSPKATSTKAAASAGTSTGSKSTPTKAHHNSTKKSAA
jgi:broad specificity phosphatase PhoE